MHALIDASPADNTVTVPSGAGILSRVIVRGRGNRVLVGAGSVLDAFAPAGARSDVADGPALRIEGDDNAVEIGDAAALTLNMTVIGSGNRIEIGAGCRLNGFAAIRCSGATLRIGAGTTMVNGSLQLHEPGEIDIGPDCMIANQVYVSLSDIHPIHDRATGQRLNPPGSVRIGAHVWLGLRCMVMKGSRIGPGAVIAAGAVVSGEVPDHVIAGGVPARVLRTDVEWHRDLDVTTPDR
ncbi:acyltransferase [Brevundimonas sp. R86498]|uniref:acyltransferase n=1 Tax=Brevundimonas sp. R86498 TaxID=3093845 RepID=UPI0037CA7997